MTGSNAAQGEFGAVSVQREGTIAFVVIDNPPVNACSWQVRRGLLSALESCSTDPRVSALVLIGSGKTFMAGADINEFGGPLHDPQMPAVIAAVEACPKPVIAAIRGAALGAGYELALGCDARIATADAIVGLPEVSLGIIPGAGGTQRLPRLVGISAAIDLIASGRRVKASEALAMGMIDAIATADLLRAEAAQLAQSLVGRKRRLGDTAVLPEPDEAVDAAAEKAIRQAKGAAAPIAAVAAIRKSLTLSFAQALAEERAAFQTLRQSHEAAARRYLFFAEREAFRVSGIGGAKARPVTSVGIVGAGTMGAGIAICFLDAGLPVTLVERDQDALDAGLARIDVAYRRMAETGRMSSEAMVQRLATITPSTDLSALAAADLVVEAVFEDMGVKQSLFRDLDRVLKPGAIMASNTSYLDLDVLARETARPGDVVGLHFFAPANVMRLLEVVRGARTAPDVLATALAIAKVIRKLPVVARVGEGFIGNRIYSAYRSQCEFMLEEGALPEEVDAALTGFGFAMGPFAVADLSGLDIAWRTRQRLAATRDPKARYSDILDRLCEAGRLGQKVGKGWYGYPEGSRRGRPDDEVRAVIDDASRRKGLSRCSMTAHGIVHRALAAMVNEAALVLTDGIAERPSDIDLAMVNGYGFPAKEGGPLFWARHQPPAVMQGWLDTVAGSVGHGFRRGEIGNVLALVTRSPHWTNPARSSA
jgi:3-hydroxyacyl-CoA dehydrogenase